MLCPFCKGEIPDDAKKCMNCGECVDPAYRKPKQDGQQGCLPAFFELCSSIVWFALLLIIAVIVVLLFLEHNGVDIF
jgi:hypothetical protein